MTGGQDRIILHLDMDSFYASAEVQRRPELDGKPVVVGADPKNGKGRGVVSTCSYEARACGIRSAMPISQAFAICPHAVFLPPDFPLYARVSEEVMRVLRSGGFRFQQVSIDEAFLDLSPMGEYPAAEEYARGLKARVLERTGLTCSVGVAPTRLVAKIASDYKKPDGLTVVTPERVGGFLAPMPVRKIPGIGRKAELSLFEAGIRTVADLQGYGLQALVNRFGRHAVRLHEAAFGIDRDPVMEQDGVKSISRETTFETDIADPDALAAAMESLVQDVHRNLAGEGFRFRTVTVKVRYSGFVTRTRSTSLSHPSDEIGKIRQAARALLGGMCDGRTVRLLGLRLSGLGRADAGQMRLPVSC